MFSSLRLAPRCVRPCARPSIQRHSIRSISSTHSKRAEFTPEPPAAEYDETDAIDDVMEEMEEAEKKAKAETREPETYKEFMMSAGETFRKANKPNKWLGGDPFPMNPSFKPPPPISDSTRTSIYELYMKDPVANDVRALSQRFHLSLKRVDAILRLKGMEADWVKGMTLQTGFRQGMETILNVPDQVMKIDANRTDVHEADMLEQDENRDAARQRYQQMYWESVPEDGREPIIPASLEHAKTTAKRFTAQRDAFKSSRRFVPRVDDPTTQTPEKVQVISKNGRPSVKFVDVGGHFINVNERVKRLNAAARNRDIAVRKADERLEDREAAIKAASYRGEQRPAGETTTP
ncbi:hypothetical protein H0H92_011238 [Tricholoma furcatifolium]|nr:hypothetical protein H0H92_011238 [Tricholoma furcatifolium]